MGISDPTLNPSNPSLVIGTEAVHPIEMAAAYATVADGGIYHAPVFVNKVVDRTGTVIYNGEKPGKRVFSREVADEAVLALRATVQWGTGTAANLPNVEAAGKTGTTSNSVDAWFNGITPSLVASVWIGDPHGEVPMYVNGVEVFGAGAPTQIWHDVMTYALHNTSYESFPNPDPALMPAVRYIDSPALARDDLIWHGYVPPPSTTTTTPKKQGPGHGPPTVTVPPAVTTTPTTAGIPKRIRPAAMLQPGAAAGPGPAVRHRGR
jgi:membrane peptidoglycan carboxypeptidase